MPRDHDPRTFAAEVNEMIGIVGTIVLVPLAVIGLALGIVRFTLAALATLGAAAGSRLSWSR